MTNQLYRRIPADPKIPRSGFIALQLQTGAMEIAFKDIEVCEIMKKSPKTRSLTAQTGQVFQGLER